MKKSSKSLNCTVCRKKLSGRQRKFCSRACKNLDTNNRHQNYVSQQSRGVTRKLELMSARGLRCERCGYNKNYAALAWHHLDPREKTHELDLRAMSNRSLSTLRDEVAKCQLLCANCHAEVHHPDCVVPESN
jgi:hypothetical protein